ncbi:MAG: hypothetical protein WCK07_22650, partial [Betaproteobacteria bacterium]
RLIHDGSSMRAGSHPRKAAAPADQGDIKQRITPSHQNIGLFWYTKNSILERHSMCHRCRPRRPPAKHHQRGFAAAAQTP